MKRILLTGAAGIVGTALRPLLRPRHEHVVLTDLAEIGALAANESSVCGDIADAEFVARVVSGVDGIVHLAGKVGPDYTFDDVLAPNIVGTQNVLAAAVKCGVRRVVYAGTHHAVGCYERGAPIDHTTAPRPDSFYGLSKAFGEAAGCYYAHRHGLEVLVIRIGYVGDSVPDERRMHTWISPRDLLQLVEIGLGTPGLGCEVVYGVSENPAPFFDNCNATRLGYRPQDRAVDHLERPELRTARPDPSTAVGRYIGGHFAKKEPM